MKTVLTSFSKISSDRGLRCDEKYHVFINTLNWRLFNSNRKTVPLKDVLYENIEAFVYEDDITYHGIPTGKQYTDIHGDIVETQEVTKENHPGRLKYKASPERILISSIRLARAPALHFSELDFNKYVFSNGFYSLSVKNGWNIRYVLYLLRTPQIKKVLDYSIYSGIGISNYKLDDLLKIQVPEVSYTEQLKFLDSIKGIEAEIAALKDNRSSTVDIVNKVFGDYFGYDYKTFYDLRKKKVFQSSYNQFGNNTDIRFSPKFHRPAGSFVYKELTSRPHRKIKKCLALPMITGQGISPSDYDNNGEYAYISMADISTWELDIENTKFVSDKYAQEHLTKRPTGYHEEVSTTTRVNDIVMMRSGEGGIGKAAIIKDDFKAIFCDFIIRMRFDETIVNPDFAYYYFRTDYFQYLIEVNKKGLGNNTNIFPNQIQELPIPDLSKEEQQRIVNSIQEELSIQQKIEEQIIAKTAKIEAILLGILEAQ